MLAAKASRPPSVHLPFVSAAWHSTLGRSLNFVLQRQVPQRHQVPEDCEALTGLRTFVPQGRHGWQQLVRLLSFPAVDLRLIGKIKAGWHFCAIEGHASAFPSCHSQQAGSILTKEHIKRPHYAAALQGHNPAVPSYRLGSTDEQKLQQ